MLQASCGSRQLQWMNPYPPPGLAQLQQAPEGSPGWVSGIKRRLRHASTMHPVMMLLIWKMLSWGHLALLREDVSIRSRRVSDLPQAKGAQHPAKSPKALSHTS